MHPWRRRQSYEACRWGGQYSPFEFHSHALRGHVPRVSRGISFPYFPPPLSLSLSPFTDQRLKSCRESFCGTERLMSARVPISLARANSVRLWIKRAIDDSFRSLNLGQIRSNRNGIAAPLKGGEFIFFFLTRANTLSNNESIADETFQFVSCFFELVNQGDELILQRFDHVSFTV